MNRPEIKICAHCDLQYIPNKYDVNTQIYCTNEDCRRERNRQRSRRYWEQLEFKTCAHCERRYIPNKHHCNRQKYCTNEDCRRERNRQRSREYREKLRKQGLKPKPRTQKQKEAYNLQRAKTRAAQQLIRKHAIPLVAQEFEKKKQVFVARARTLVSVLEYFLFTFAGIAVLCTGDRRRTSVLGLQKLLRECYQLGVSHTEADANFNPLKEILNELIRELDSPVSAAEIAEALQLA